jgi:hypothetical protein
LRAESWSGNRCTAGFQARQCPLWVNSVVDDRDKPRPMSALPPEADTRISVGADVADRAHFRRNPRGRKKRQSRRELSERLEVGRPEMFGGFSSGHFWIEGCDCGRLRGPQRGKGRAVPGRCSSICSSCCQLMVGIPGGGS